MTVSKQIVSLNGSEILTATVVVVSFWSGMLLMYAIGDNKLPELSSPVQTASSSQTAKDSTQLSGQEYPVACILDSDTERVP